MKRFSAIVKQGVQFKKLNVEESTQFLTLMMTIAGIPESAYPSKNTLYVIVDLVLRNYGTHTDKEIRSAFEMAASGQLEVPEHYNNFSFKYFANIMNAWKSEVNKEMRDENKTAEIPQIEFKGEVDWQDTLDYLIEQAHSIHVNKLHIPIHVYDWMVRKQLINPNVEEKKEMFAKKLEQLQIELANKYAGGIASNDDKALLRRLNDGVAKGSSEHLLIANESKKEFVKNYIKKEVVK